MARYGVGQAVSRKEDDRFTTGRGSYVDDLILPDQLYAVLVRSPHAHAELCAVDSAEARGAAGVLAVVTGADIAVRPDSATYRCCRGSTTPTPAAAPRSSVRAT